jgi:hypothetical protein
VDFDYSRDARDSGSRTRLYIALDRSLCLPRRRSDPGALLDPRSSFFLLIAEIVDFYYCGDARDPGLLTRLHFALDRSLLLPWRRLDPGALLDPGVLSCLHIAEIVDFAHGGTPETLDH